ATDQRSRRWRRTGAPSSTDGPAGRDGRYGRRRGWGRMGVMEHRNLLGGPPATYLPDDPAAAELAADADPAAVAAAHPGCLAAWAALADPALATGGTGA